MKNTWNRLGSVLAVTALLGALAACSNDKEPETTAPGTTPTTGAIGTETPGTDDPSNTSNNPSESPSLPTITSDPQTGEFDYCKDQKPFTGGAADEFGADAVADAYCTMVTLEMEQSFLEDHLRNDGSVLKPIDFSIWTRYMTADTADQFNATVAKALKDDQDAKQDVWSLTFFDAVSKEAGYVFTDEPTTLDRRFSPASTEVDEVDGRKRLLLTFDVFANLNVQKVDTDDAYLIPIARRITFALIKNPVATNDENDWLIDSWSGKFTVDEPKKRPSDYLGDTEVAPA